MDITKTDLARIFNEWAKQYAENPEGFSGILDDNGKPFTDYGEQCAAHALLLHKQLSKARKG